MEDSRIVELYWQKNADAIKETDSKYGAYRGVKQKRLHGDHFRITVEPVIVKKYRKTLVNRGFCKKKLDTRFDTHCIKTGVQLWSECRDSNPRPLGPEGWSDIFSGYVGAFPRLSARKISQRHPFWHG